MHHLALRDIEHSQEARLEANCDDLVFLTRGNRRRRVGFGGVEFVHLFHSLGVPHLYRAVPADGH